jgi:endonuclease/exonuclease/phosphatase family metal-dependent hydrolase
MEKKSLLIYIVLMVSVLSDVFSQPAELLVMSYNVENLYDTIDDPHVDDAEFLPGSAKQWGRVRYAHKLDTIARVIAEAGEVGLVGLIEVENRKVVEDLAATNSLKGRSLKVVHHDSPDQRGIDVALMYDPDKLKLLSHRPIRVPMPEGERPTRDILYAAFKNGKDTLHVFQNHWPSRRGGAGTDTKRALAASTLRQHSDSLLRINGGANIIIMGDLNDTPQDSSIRISLGAQCTGADLIELMCPIEDQGGGTHYFKGQWQVLDHLIVSKGLIDGKLHVKPKSAEVFSIEWMFFKNSKGGLEPSRTYGGDRYFGGVSDHLPVLMRLVR